MPIAVRCENCRREFRTPDSYAGRRLKCPRCGAAVEVPPLALPRHISEHPGISGAHQPQSVDSNPPPSPPGSTVEIMVNTGSVPPPPSDEGEPPSQPPEDPAPDDAVVQSPAPPEDAAQRQEPAASPSDPVDASLDISASLDIDVPKRRVPPDQSTVIERGPVDPHSVSVAIAVSQQPPDAEESLPVAQPLDSWHDIPAVEPLPPGEPVQWYLHTDEGEYGPVSRRMLDRWVDEGRVDATCQLFCEGWSQWRWAEDIYPKLAQPFHDEVVPGGEPAVEASGGNPAAAGPAARIPAHDAADEHRITPAIRRTLAEIRPWVIFLAVVGFLFGGLAGVALVTLLVAEIVTTARFNAVLLAAALLGPGLYLVLAYFLLALGQHIRTFLRTSAAADLERLLAVERVVWQIAGIAMAVLLAVCLVVLGSVLLPS